MQVTEILNQTGGISTMARELGIDESEAASAATALLPAILGGLKKQARDQPAGLEGLAGILGRLGGGSLLDDVLGPQPTNVNRGNDVLGQIFGSKDVSRTVAGNASAKTGLDPTILKRMLPMLAMLVAGYMAKQGGASAPARPNVGESRDLQGGQRREGNRTAGSGAGGWASMLDLNGDGNALDDIIGMAGRLMR